MYGTSAMPRRIQVFYETPQGTRTVNAEEITEEEVEELLALTGSLPPEFAGFFQDIAKGFRKTCQSIEKDIKRSARKIKAEVQRVGKKAGEVLKVVAPVAIGFGLGGVGGSIAKILGASSKTVVGKLLTTGVSGLVPGHTVAGGILTKVGTALKGQAVSSVIGGGAMAPIANLVTGAITGGVPTRVPEGFEADGTSAWNPSPSVDPRKPESAFVISPESLARVASGFTETVARPGQPAEQAIIESGLTGTLNFEFGKAGEEMAEEKKNIWQTLLGFGEQIVATQIAKSKQVSQQGATDIVESLKKGDFTKALTVSAEEYIKMLQGGDTNKDFSPTGAPPAGLPNTGVPSDPRTLGSKELEYLAQQIAQNAAYNQQVAKSQEQLAFALGKTIAEAASTPQENRATGLIQTAAPPPVSGATLASYAGATDITIQRNTAVMIVAVLALIFIIPGIIRSLKL